MKKTSLLCLVMMLGLMTSAVAQSDTIAGWSFPDSTDLNFNANYGLSGNLGYDLRAEDSAATTRTLTYTQGATDFAATATGWDNGMDNKFWSVKFKANGYTDLKVSSKLYSDSIMPGPKDWKIQCRKSSGSWTDITGSTITAAHNWTSGASADLALPSSFDNPGSTSIYIRWIMTSNLSVTGSTVLPTGISKIDDVIITGINANGVETVIFEDKVFVYPNPSSDVLFVESFSEISRVTIYDISGKLHYSAELDSHSGNIDLRNLDSGIYIVKIKLADSDNIITRKIVVQ